LISDIIVIGGGQAGLACGYYLKKAGFEFTILDDQPSPGGAWQHAWDALTLFSPSEFSSLPGWLMPRSKNYYPSKSEVIEYLAEYEKRYTLPIVRPVKVSSVQKFEDRFILQTDRGEYTSKALISATGTWSKPFIPPYPKQELFKGIQIHSAEYRTPEEFQGRRVLVVGEGNSGAQILAEVSTIASAMWVAQKPPVFLPDDVDGRVLFFQSSTKYHAMMKGESPSQPKYDIGSIVMVPSVKQARERGVLVAHKPFREFYEHGVIWEDGTKEEIDAIIWCTGFKFALDHLDALGIRDADGKIRTEGTRSLDIPGLWLVGYGGWTGYASATLIGVGRTAKKTSEEIKEYLGVSLEGSSHSKSGE